MPLDTKSRQVVDFAPEHGNETSFVAVPLPCGSRWHCVRTHAQAEHWALDELTRQRWLAYLPLHLDNRRIVPLFSRYLFVAFAPLQDAWGAIRHTRGVAELLCHDIGQPSAVPPGVVEDLIARTSPRRIVDDPGSAPFPNPQPQRARWQNITSLSADARTALLLRLFGT